MLTRKRSKDYNNPISMVMYLEQIFQDVNEQMLETTYTLRSSQLLKITPNFKKYMWQKLKLEKTNIVIQQMLEPSVATMVETYSKLDTMAIEIDNQMVVIQVQVGKNIVEDILIDGGANANIIIENLITKLGLPKLRPTPYHLIVWPDLQESSEI